ncbi:MAG: ATP-binding protein [candidate division WOR-3 bacterium]
MANYWYGLVIRNDVKNYCINNGILVDRKDSKDLYKDVRPGDTIFIIKKWYNSNDCEIYGPFIAKSGLEERPIQISKLTFDLQIKIEPLGEISKIEIPDNADITKAIFQTNKRQIDEKIGRDIEEQLQQIRLEAQEKFGHKPSLKFEDVIGFEYLKKRMKKLIKDYERKEAYNLQIARGFFLFGPPGTGKTIFIDAVANELGCDTYPEITPAVIAGFPGEAEKNLENMLDSYFKKFENEGIGVMFIDECESLFPARAQNYSSVMARIVPTLLRKIDRLLKYYPHEKIFIFAVSNHPEDVDPAFLRPGRFAEIYYVGLPKEENIRKLFNFYIRQKMNSDTFDQEIFKDDCKELLKFLEDKRKSLCNRDNIHPEFGRFSPADIEKIIKDAALEAHYQNRKMTLQDLKEEIEKTMPSITNETLIAMEDFKKSHPNWKDADTGNQD